MTSGPEVPKNLAKAATLIARAAARGAELIALPENFALMTGVEQGKLAAAETLDAARPGPILASMMEAAARHEIYLVLGGMPERTDGGDRIHNNCVLLGPDGTLRATYRKIHLFDVFIPDGATYHESKTVEPGARPVVA